MKPTFLVVRMIKMLLVALLASGCTYRTTVLEEDDDGDANMNVYVDQPIDDLDGSANDAAPNGGWSVSGTLTTGQGSGLGTEVVARPAGKMVTLQVQFPDPGTYSIQFGLTPGPGVTPAVAVYIAEAIISWTVAGNTITRRVTVANNVTVSGVGQSVRVVMWDTTPTDVALPYQYTAGLEYTVFASVTKGLRPTTRIQPVLFPGFSDTPSADVNGGPGLYFVTSNMGAIQVPLPQGSGVNAVLVLMSDPNGIATAAGDQAAVGAGMNALAAGAGLSQWNPFSQPGVWVPVPPGATSLGLVNNISPPSGTPLGYTVFYAIDG